jgi:NNP family nitrate/nitrite transporter-like MFS transporter
MGAAMIPVALVFAVFVCIAKDSPKPRPRTSLGDYGRMLRESDTVWLSLLYSLTFGGFVGLSSFLTTFFHEQYALSRVTAGDLTTIVVVAGSFLRPVDGSPTASAAIGCSWACWPWPRCASASFRRYLR